MEEKTTKRILLFVAGFYVMIAAFAVCVLSLSGSVFKAQGADNLLEYIEQKNQRAEELAKEFENEDKAAKLEGLEALLGDTVSELAEESREMGEIKADASEEAAAEEPASEEAAAADDTAAEAPAEEPASVEPASGAEELLPEEKHYYSFISNNETTDLRMREEANENSKIVYRLKPGTTGYVVYLGDEWSWVYADGYEGYCANEYLTLKEISEEDYPEELRNGS
ncbi:MAG: SH3 domain-containing protein [Lachnospiraceae bacterium]|nr:SH3 domain-containing protein [Lachnospiraceae bacterium]